MDRRDVLAKATIDTAVVGSAALLPLEVARRFLVQMKESDPVSNRWTLDIREAPTGQLNKFNTSSRIIRKAEENTDDGYRVGANFPTVQYASVKIRLPWEVTEDAFHENIGGQGLEQTITSDMEKQFNLDLVDLEFNGDETSGNAFLQINRGLLRELAVNGLHRVNGAAINAGVLSKSHFFAAKQAMPNKYKAQGGLVWCMSPNRHLDWVETLTDRISGAGDAALVGQGAAVAGPLNTSVLEVPFMPDDRILLIDPAQVHRVVTWQIRRRRVTGETDAQLAALDKRFYVFFLKHDMVVEEHDAIVDVYGLAAV
jgi:hypothetical protein